MRKNYLVIALFTSLILLAGCGRVEAALPDSVPIDPTSESDSCAEELVPYVAAYNYETRETYNIYADMNTPDGNSAEKSIVFQGRELNAYGTFLCYDLEKDSDEYCAEPSRTIILLHGESGLKFKGIAFYKDFYWVLRPLYEEGDGVLPLLGKFSDEELAEIEKLSSITVGGKEYKTHPFDIIYLSLDEEYTKEIMPDFKADKSRAYLVEGEAENIELGIGYSGFSNTSPNMVLSAEDIGESPFDA